MKKRTFTLFAPFLLLGSIAFAQSPFKPQLALPVFFNSLAKKVANTEKKVPDAYLSGIALMFLDTADTNDELLMSGSSDLVIWHDNVGKSTLLTLVVPDSLATGKLELMFFDSKCAASLWRKDRKTGESVQTFGELEVGKNGYSLNFSTNNQADAAAFTAVIDVLNVQLMELHTRNLRRAQVKSWYNKDSINVIIGKDSQFETDNELFWLDQPFRDRLITVASNDFSKLFLFGNGTDFVQDSIKSINSQLFHEAKPFTQNGCQGIHGTIAITLKPEIIANYMFFNPKHIYRLYVDYTFCHGGNIRNNFSINRLGLRNKNNGDFVDMDLFDFVSNGLPIMYVDLINGVVTSSYKSWDISKAIHFVEDVFKATALPYE
jgi:hypothetical protein